MAEEAAAKQAEKQAALDKQLEILQQLNDGALLPEVHGPLLQELHSKLALTSPGQGTSDTTAVKQEDDATSTASWLRVGTGDTTATQAELRRKNGDVHA